MSSPLRILQVATSLGGWGGLELHIIRLAKGLQDRGHTVTVACREGGFIDARAREAGLSVAHGMIRKHEDFRALPQFRRLIREVAPDIIHVHADNDAVVPVLAGRLEGGRAAVLTRHLPVDIKRLFRLFLVNDRLCDRIVGVSEFIRQRLVQQGLRSDRVVTIYNSADRTLSPFPPLRVWEIRSQLGVSDDDFLVGMVGRLDPEKGVDDLIRAVALLESRPVKAVIVGDGVQMQALRALAEQHNISNRINLTGFRADATEIMASLDAFVLASTWDEPFATVVIEAMLRGVPVVATATGGTPEQVDNGRTGLLVPPRQPEKLGAAIEKLLDDRSLGPEMGRSGREKALKMFTIETMCESIDALYREILADG